jgi:hypothetical protein
MNYIVTVVSVSYCVWKRFSIKLKFYFVLNWYIFYIFNLFYSIDIKNNFLKIKKYYFNIF